jgi:hypothetical protein
MPVIENVLPSDRTPRQVEREFRKLVDRGFRILPAGRARRDPSSLLSGGYTPKHMFRLFDTTYYLTNLRFDDAFGFFVAYVLLGEGSVGARRAREIHPRIFYKDLSLVWRVASHCIRTQGDNWIGKGDLKTGFENGVEMEYSAEETTNLPLEIQAALDVISRKARVRRDDRVVELILHNAPEGRFEPYSDFVAPRRKAMARIADRIHRGEPVAWFERENDPTSLRFAAGFAPDFVRGIVDESRLGSRMYGGGVRKFRILSKNRQIQYQFIAAPKHVWIIPPQALSSEIMSYGTRVTDVNLDENLCVPGYEYHFIDDSEDPPRLHSQIPEGFAGAASEVDPSRADASPWLDELGVIREFRRKVLRRG